MSRPSQGQGFEMAVASAAAGGVEGRFGVPAGVDDVPWGYHTTCAAHGYDLYYLNALAGDRRSMAAADDLAFAWVRPSWQTMETDARVTLVTLEGRRS
jgi:5-deoxy-D-glucuronate isomerase